MTPAFQPGDRVRRLIGKHQGMEAGDVGTVLNCDGDNLRLREYPGVIFTTSKYCPVEPTAAPPKQDKTQVGGDHYTKMAIQPYEYAHKNKLGYLESNVVKYVSRHGDKNGKEDLLKAIHSLQVLIELQYPES